MATTTNYGWTTPDDTALVKDGASAIRTLGTSVDTTTKNLNPETTLGDIAYRSSTSNVNTRLGIGSAGQVLTVASGVPSWATASAGGMTLISETTASGLSSLDFTSISGSYKQLLLVWSGIYHSTTGSGFNIRFNNNSTAAAYQGMVMQGDTNTGNVINRFYQDTEAYTGTGVIMPFGVNQTNSTNAFRWSKGTLMIDNYASASKFKFYNFQFSSLDASADHAIVTGSGIFSSTTAITQLNIFRTAGSATFSNATNTSIRLYGVD